MSLTGDRIKTRRKQLGMTADELAERIGKNRATVYRYESDAIENMPINIVPPLAKALGVSPVWLMGWTDDPYYMLENRDAEMTVREKVVAYGECDAPYCSEVEKQVVKGYRRKKEAQLAVRMLLEVK